MRSVLWYIFTIGIPVLGAGICTVGGVLCYRGARAHRVGRVAAALGYLIATSLPVGLAFVAVKFGSYLAMRRQIDVFFGEDTWALFIFMGYYFLLALACNLVLWLALGLLRRRHNESTTA